MEALGIDPKLLIAQVINFVIVLLLLRKFAYNPILNMLDQRSKTIATGLKDSEEASKKLESANEEKEKILEKAYKEAGEMLTLAKKEAKAEAEKILKTANDQAALIRKTSLEESEQAKSSAITDAKKEVSSLIMLALEKIVGQKIDQKEREALTAKAIEEI